MTELLVLLNCVFNVLGLALKRLIVSNSCLDVTLHYTNLLVSLRDFNPNLLGLLRHLNAFPFLVNIGALHRLQLGP